ncbi:MAG: DUF4838 domain-containing protein [Pirellulaceae bacterium]|nr:DUF4838 domain-containing protein [Pirellulaceae bacterium]
MKTLLTTILGIGLLCSQMLAEETTTTEQQSQRDPLSITRIVIPDTVTAAEQHAANELLTNIKMMTDCLVPIVFESAVQAEDLTGRALVVGRTRFNLKEHNPDEWPQDTIYVGYGDGDISIVGQGEQGTLFAAFEFLRDQGCRWYMPVTYHKLEVGRHVPQREKLQLSGKPKKYTPTFVDRGWHMTPVMPGPHYRDWATRNGVNALTTGDTCILYPAPLGRGYEKQTGHTLHWFVPSGNHPSTVEAVQENFAAHPDWYPLVSGERTWSYHDGRSVQACLSNPEVVDKVARDILRYAADGYENHENPNWRLFSIGHNDEPTYWCECEQCRALDGPDSLWKANDSYDAYPDDPENQSGNGPLSRRYTIFANRVARQVAQERPDLMISFYAYGSTVAPPRDPQLKLEKNVVVEFAYSGHCLQHDIDDPTCPTNVKMKRWIEDWSRRGTVIFYDYPPTGPHAHAPTGFFRHYQKLLQFLEQRGVMGLSGESQGVWAGSSLFHYLRARLMWDTQANVDRLIDEYCQHLFGNAAETMRAYFRSYEQALQQHPDHMIWGRWISQFNPQVLSEMQQLLETAQQQTDDPAVELRLKLTQVSLNTFVITQVENTPLTEVDPQRFGRYQALRSQTLAMIQEMNLPYPMAATGPFIDRLRSNGYDPPFQALRGQERMVLPQVWRFRTDPSDEGIGQEWPRLLDAKESPWRDIRVDKFWTSQGIPFHGSAWYTVTFTAPAEVDEDLWLLFDMLDGAADIWIDGQLAGTTPADPWDKPKGIDLTPWIKPGQEQRLVLRVVKHNFAAGINGRVRLMEAFKTVGDR